MFVHGMLQHFKDNEVCKVNSVLRNILQWISQEMRTPNSEAKQLNVQTDQNMTLLLGIKKSTYHT